MIDAGVSPERLLGEYFRKLSLEDMQTMKAILKSYSPDGSEVAESEELPMLELVTGRSSSLQ